MNDADGMRLKAIPRDYCVIGSHDKGQVGLEVFPHAVHDFFEMANGGAPVNHWFDDQAFIEAKGLAYFEITRITCLGMEAMIRKDNW